MDLVSWDPPPTVSLEGSHHWCSFDGPLLVGDSIASMASSILVPQVQEAAGRAQLGALCDPQVPHVLGWGASTGLGLPRWRPHFRSQAWRQGWALPQFTSTGPAIILREATCYSLALATPPSAFPNGHAVLRQLWQGLDC